MIFHITNNDSILAIIISANYSSEGIKFFTPSTCTQQIGYMNRPSGYVIPPHIHNPVSREILYTNEVLFIKSGKIRADFYDENQDYLESRILNKGDIILLLHGGHGFEMLEPSEIIEVKQGPYAGEKDKTRFSTVSLDKIEIKGS